MYYDSFYHCTIPTFPSTSLGLVERMFFSLYFAPILYQISSKMLENKHFRTFYRRGYLCPASRSGPGFPPYAGVFRHQVQISDHVPRFSDHHISLTRFSDQSFFLIYIRFSATPIFIFLNKFVNHMLTFDLNNVIIHLSRKG